MNFLILGAGEAELAWAHWILDRPEHRLVGAHPGFPAADLDPDGSAVPPAPDLDAALAVPGVDLAIAGGPAESRMEALRRGAALGWPAICPHPPGPDSEAYYQVSLSREETGTMIVPDLPMRLHPGVAMIREALASGELGAFRGLR